MNSFIFNDSLGRYEAIQGLLSGKSSFEIADEYGLSTARTRQYAREKKLPYLGTADKVHVYLFDAAAEKAFANRPLKSPGRPFVPKPPKVPGKPGRPRKEKPVDSKPKRQAVRPKKNPKEPLDIVKRPRGRPKK